MVTYVNAPPATESVLPHKRKRYVAPSHPLAAAIWREYMSFTSALALSSMEPWELVLVCTHPSLRLLLN